MASTDEFILQVSKTLDSVRETVLSGEPNWLPLEEALPAEWCDGFMWMGRVDGDPPIELYKHGITRRYLNLDSSGRAWRFDAISHTYVPIRFEEAIDHVFEGIEDFGASRATKYDCSFIAEHNRKLHEAGFTVIM